MNLDLNLAEYVIGRPEFEQQFDPKLKRYQELFARTFSFKKCSLLMYEVGVGKTSAYIAAAARSRLENLHDCCVIVTRSECIHEQILYEIERLDSTTDYYKLDTFQLFQAEKYRNFGSILLVIDEIQCIADGSTTSTAASSDLTSFLDQLRALDLHAPDNDSRIILSSATPIRNDVSELAKVYQIFDVTTITELKRKAAVYYYPSSISHVKTVEEDVYVEVSAEQEASLAQKTAKVSEFCRRERLASLYNLNNVKDSNICEKVAEYEAAKRLKPTGCSFIYVADYITEPLLALRYQLELQGFREFSSSSQTKEPTFLVVKSDGGMKHLRTFNSTENALGAKIAVVIGSKMLMDSINLRHVTDMHILLHPWNIASLEQAKGRSFRMNSFDDLLAHFPAAQLQVKIHNYYAVNNSGKKLKNWEVSQAAWQKQREIDEVVEDLKHSCVESYILASSALAAHKPSIFNHSYTKLELIKLRRQREFDLSFSREDAEVRLSLDEKLYLRGQLTSLSEITQLEFEPLDYTYASLLLGRYPAKFSSAESTVTESLVSEPHSDQAKNFASQVRAVMRSFCCRATLTASDFALLTLTKEYWYVFQLEGNFFFIESLSLLTSKTIKTAELFVNLRASTVVDQYGVRVRNLAESQLVQRLARYREKLPEFELRSIVGNEVRVKSSRYVTVSEGGNFQLRKGSRVPAVARDSQEGELERLEVYHRKHLELDSQSCLTTLYSYSSSFCYFRL